MGIIKKIQRWFKDPRRSAVRRPVNQRSPIPIVHTQSVTANTPTFKTQNPTEHKISERTDISRRMKEMVDRSTELRNSKNIRNPQNLRDYQERVSSRLARVPTKQSRTNIHNR